MAGQSQSMTMQNKKRNYNRQSPFVSPDKPGAVANSNSVSVSPDRPPVGSNSKVEHIESQAAVDALLHKLSGQTAELNKVNNSGPLKTTSQVQRRPSATRP